jgi:mannose-1-phosphate guanylyltransferase/mannose-6-phosphate isomerase
MQENQFIERPWGGYQIIYQDFGLVVKILTINPGKRLSLQKHALRSETWHAVTEGLVAVVGDYEYEMVEGEPVFVDVGKVHRLINNGDNVGRVIEVIMGEYDEDDIVRLEDDFGRGDTLF